MNNQQQVREHDVVVVSGIGLESPIGGSLNEVVSGLKNGRLGISKIEGFDVTGLSIQHAGEIHRPLGSGARKDMDRTGLLGLLAARKAVEDAHIDLSQFPPERVALVVGICAGGQKDRVRLEATRAGDRGEAVALVDTSHFAQTQEIANALGIHGRCVTVSTACASSGTALGHAWELLLGGGVDVVVAGGTDAFSFFTYAGFYALGAMADRACSPFSENIGVTFGEGAAFVVLERLSAAERRGASTHGALLGYGSTADCYHMTSPDPSGAGLTRAMHQSVQRGSVESSRIDYVNAHGTGTRDNDLAETSAIKSFFQERPSVPPVSSSKSFFGHTLGAAGALEFAVSMLCMEHGFIPPTLGFETARPGCDLDYVPNQGRQQDVRAFASTSAAFGGVNVCLLGGQLGSDLRPASLPRPEEIVITGLGVVSALAEDCGGFATALASDVSALAPSTSKGATPGLEGRIGKFNLRRVAPTIDARRLDRVNQFALGAAAQALKNPAGVRPIAAERIGAVMALTRGPAGTEQKFLEALSREGIRGLSPKHFPAVVMSTICGQICDHFKLAGAPATVVDGVGAGLHGLLQAVDTLRANPALDAILVVAADEIGELYTHAYRSLGRLVAGEQLPALYAGDSGMALAEGAAAILIERRSSAVERGASVLSTIEGIGASNDATRGGLDPSGQWLAKAIELALAEARLTSDELDLVFGHGRGEGAVDQHELAALDRVFPGLPPTFAMSCLSGHTGVLEATSSLLDVVAATLSLNNGVAYPVLSGADLPSTLPFVTGEPQAGQFEHALVTATTEFGNNAALILRGERVPE